MARPSKTPDAVAHANRVPQEPARPFSWRGRAPRTEGRPILEKRSSSTSSQGGLFCSGHKGSLGAPHLTLYNSPGTSSYGSRSRSRSRRVVLQLREETHGILALTSIEHPPRIVVATLLGALPRSGRQRVVTRGRLLVKEVDQVLARERTRLILPSNSQPPQRRPRNATASRTAHGSTLSVRARPATCRPEAPTPVGTRWSTIVFEEGRTPRGASRSTTTRVGSSWCRLRTTLTARHSERWPCKSNPVRLGSCVSRATARREIAGFRPGFWPQGQLRHPSSLGDFRQGAGLAAGRHPEPQGRTGAVGPHQRHRRSRHVCARRERTPLRVGLQRSARWSHHDVTRDTSGRPVAVMPPGAVSDSRRGLVHLEDDLETASPGGRLRRRKVARRDRCCSRPACSRRGDLSARPSGRAE